MDFTIFDFNPAIMTGIKKLGYASPTPIQEKAIPPVLAGRDVMGLAQTGTGKTAAFVLPLIQKIAGKPRGKPRILIVAPTRELAQQTHEFITSLEGATGVRSVAVYGGVGMTPQINRLRSGVEAVVACPGRLLDHVEQGTIDLRSVEALVIDEADRMLDMGFLPDIRRIVRSVPPTRQTLLFSATMPEDIRRLSKDILSKPEVVQVEFEKPLETVSHSFYPVPQYLKTALLLDILARSNGDTVLVFTRTKHRAKRLAPILERAGHKAASLQGNLSQSKRQAALDGFKHGHYKVLVATDIAARGIDVSDIALVVNYDMPDTADAYTHRIGRTGRMERTGNAYTFITGEDEEMIRLIERALGSRIERRQLEGFDYGAPAPKREPRPQGGGYNRGPRSQGSGYGGSHGQGSGHGGPRGQGGRPSGQHRPGGQPGQRRDFAPRGGQDFRQGGAPSGPRPQSGGSPSGGGSVWRQSNGKRKDWRRR